MQPSSRPSAIPTTHVRALVQVFLSQKIIGIRKSDFQSFPGLEMAFKRTVCWTLRPFPDCENINVTRIIDVFQDSPSSAQNRALLSNIAQVDYTLLFDDQYQAPVAGASSVRYGDPGKEKRMQLIASVQSGEFFNIFTQFVPVQNSGNSSAALTQLVSQLEMAEPTVSDPTYSLFLAKKTASPTHSPTLEPTYGLGLSLRSNELVVFFSFLAYAFGVVGVAFGVYYYRKRRALAAVAPLVAGLGNKRGNKRTIFPFDALESNFTDSDGDIDDDASADSSANEIEEFAKQLATRPPEPVISERSHTRFLIDLSSSSGSDSDSECKPVRVRVKVRAPLDRRAFQLDVRDSDSDESY